MCRSWATTLAQSHIPIDRQPLWPPVAQHILHHRALTLKPYQLQPRQHRTRLLVLTNRRRDTRPNPVPFWITKKPGAPPQPLSTPDYSLTALRPLEQIRTLPFQANFPVLHQSKNYQSRLSVTRTSALRQLPRAHLLTGCDTQGHLVNPNRRQSITPLSIIMVEMLPLPAASALQAWAHMLRLRSRRLQLQRIYTTTRTHTVPQNLTPE
jgi:hypothetical protein